MVGVEGLQHRQAPAPATGRSLVPGRRCRRPSSPPGSILFDIRTSVRIANTAAQATRGLRDASTSRSSARWPTTRRAASTSSTTTQALRLLQHLRGGAHGRSRTRRWPSARTCSTSWRRSAPRARREWRTCAHDEFAAGAWTARSRFASSSSTRRRSPADKEGSVRLDGEPAGAPMGRIVARARPHGAAAGQRRVPLPRRPRPA